MAAITSVCTVDHVAKLLGEDPELLKAIVSNDDNLTYGSIVSVYTGQEASLTALTDIGIEELKDMLAAARRPPKTGTTSSTTSSQIPMSSLGSRPSRCKHNRPVTVSRAPVLYFCVIYTRISSIIKSL